MATELQKNLAKEIIFNAKRKKPKNKKEMLVSAGYDITTAEATPTRTIEQKGVREALEDYGFSEANAKRVVGQILNKEKAQDKDRLKAADMVFEVHGSKAPTKNVSVNLNVSDEKKGMANRAIAAFFNGRHRGNTQ